MTDASTPDVSIEGETNGLANYPEATKPRGLTYFLIALTTIGVVALLLAIISVQTNIAQDKSRNEERIVADLTSCARGNTFRANLRDLAESNTHYVDETLAGVLDLADTSEAFRDRLAERLRPARQETVEIIGVLTEPIECVEVTPGADSLPADLIPEGADP